MINVAVFGDGQESTIKHLAEKIKDDITNLPGITLAELRGLRKAEVSIEISEETLRRHGLTLGQVAQEVRKGSLDLPAGRIKTRGGEILIRISETIRQDRAAIPLSIFLTLSPHPGQAAAVHPFQH